jgi:hypothetical protein
MDGYDGLIISQFMAGAGVACVLVYAVNDGPLKGHRWVTLPAFLAWFWTYPLFYAAWWRWVDFTHALFQP